MAVKMYQVAGGTSGQGKLPAWRDFYLDGISELRLNPGAGREGDSHKQPSRSSNLSMSTPTFPTR